MSIDNLLVDFDEMGSVPTTLCENPEEYAREWKKQLVDEIERLKEENEYLDRTDEERYQEAEANVRAGIASGGTSCHWCEDIIRKKAVKEFAEKLKEICVRKRTYIDIDDESEEEYYFDGAVTIDEIDKLLKQYGVEVES